MRNASRERKSASPYQSFWQAKAARYLAKAEEAEAAGQYGLARMWLRHAQLAESV